MRNTSLFPFSLILLGFLFLFTCQTENHYSEETINERQAIKSKIDSIGQYFIDQDKTMGLSIAVMQAGDTLYNRGFGFADSNRTQAVTNDHYFLMASISKLVSGFLAMRLVEEGKLSLDDRLYDLLPDFPNPEQAKKIKLRHLLSHTSGLLDYAIVIDSVYLETGIHPTEADYYNFFVGRELLFEPGSRYYYTNSGFVLFAMIVERLSGKPFSEELDRLINIPADLDLKLIKHRLSDPLMSTYFELVDSTIEYRHTWPWIKGDGGLTNTALGLAHFPFKWSDGNLISDESFEEMTTPFQMTSGIKTGYGMGVRSGDFVGEPILGHTGGNQSAYATMTYYPEKDLSVVVFVNTDNTPTDALYINGFVALAALGKEAPILEEIEIKDADLSPYLGVYEQYAYLSSSPTSYTVYQDSLSGRLYLKYTQRDTKGQELFYLGNHTFSPSRFPMDQLVFVPDETGKMAAYRAYWNGLFQRMGFRVD